MYMPENMQPRARAFRRTEEVLAANMRLATLHGVEDAVRRAVGKHEIHGGVRGDRVGRLEARDGRGGVVAVDGAVVGEGPVAEFGGVRGCVDGEAGAG